MRSKPVMLGPFQRGTWRNNGWPAACRRQGQIFLADPLFSEKSPEDKVELRVPIIVVAIDFLTALGQVMF
jgi:hypothetical protein